MLHYISKTDFKIGSSCPKKLWYKKHHYPTVNDENEYMEYLAKGGYLVGKMAQLVYEGGTDLSGITDWQLAVAETKKLIDNNENIIIYEAAFYSDNKLARVDILKKEGKIISIIEVKAKSQDSENESKKISDEYLEDVLFQVVTVEEAFPDLAIKGFLLLPDKSKPNQIEGLAGWFVVDEEEQELVTELEELPGRSNPGFSLPKVKFRYEGDPQEQEYLQQLKKHSILELRDIEKADYEGNWDAAKTAVNNKIKILYEGLINNVSGTTDKKCKSCEYQSDNGGMNGFKECWKDYDGLDLSALTLYYGGSVKLNKEKYYLDHLIEHKTVSLSDIDIAVLTKGKNEKEFSGRTIRQLLQITAHQTNEEQSRTDLLKDEIKSWEFPLYFIDFETYTGAIPFHKNMCPYELLAFQWSCHKINSPGAEPEHTEWINIEDTFPSFRFAESLMKVIGKKGTPLMWSNHENTVLRHIIEQMDTQKYKNPELKKWLISMTHDSKVKRKGRLTDMAKVCEKTYLHPDCKGKVSIKKILPSIWINDNNPDIHATFKKYLKRDDQGKIMDPYKTLSVIQDLEMVTALESEDVIADGTAAMKAYFEMMFGRGRADVKIKEEIKMLLLQYCELDTAAMVIIYNYWQKLLSTK